MIFFPGGFSFSSSDAGYRLNNYYRSTTRIAIYHEKHPEYSWQRQVSEETRSEETQEAVLNTAESGSSRLDRDARRSRCQAEEPARRSRRAGDVRCHKAEEPARRSWSAGAGHCQDEEPTHGPGASRRSWRAGAGHCQDEEPTHGPGASIEVSHPAPS